MLVVAVAGVVRSVLRLGVVLLRRLEVLVGFGVLVRMLAVLGVLRELVVVRVLDWVDSAGSWTAG